MVPSQWLLGHPSVMLSGQAWASSVFSLYGPYRVKSFCLWAPAAVAYQLQSWLTFLCFGEARLHSMSSPIMWLIVCQLKLPPWLPVESIFWSPKSPPFFMFYTISQHQNIKNYRTSFLLRILFFRLVSLSSTVLLTRAPRMQFYCWSSDNGKARPWN